MLTRTSSVNVGITKSTGNFGNSYTSARNVTTEPVPTDDGPGNAIGMVGDAVALGDNTLATASITGVISGGTSKGEVAFTAAAQGGTAYTSTYANVMPSSGGDRSLRVSGTDNSSTWEGDYQTSTSSSFVNYQMLDFDKLRNSSSRSEAAPIEDRVGSRDEWSDTTWDDWKVDGNYAAFDISAEAYGENSYVNVQVAAFTLEDALSQVSSMVVAAVG